VEYAVPDRDRQLVSLLTDFGETGLEAFFRIGAAQAAVLNELLGPLADLTADFIDDRLEFVHRDQILDDQIALVMEKVKLCCGNGL